MKVRILSSAVELAELRGAWRGLCADAAPTDPFRSWEWFDAAWAWCGVQAEPCVATCERDGSLIGLLPLMWRHGARWRTLEFITVPDTQFCDAIVMAADAAGVAAAFADELARPAHRFDVLRIANLRSGSFVLSELVPALTARGFACRAEQATTNPRVALDGDFADWLGRRSRRVKKAINLAANRLGRAGAVEVAWLAPGEGEASDVDRAIDVITAISARSWKKDTGNALDRPGPQAFVRRLAHHMHARGSLSVWTLALDGRPLAMELQLTGGGDVYALRSDFDAACETLSPGAHLGRALLERMFGRGWRTYWMGPGDNAYKQRWAEGGEPVFALSVYARSVRGRALAAWETALKPAARTLRDRWRARGKRPASTEEDSDASGRGP